MMGQATVGHPVDVATGAVYSTKRDLLIPGKFPMIWNRNYHSSRRKRGGLLGPGWTSPYAAKLTRIGKDYHYVTPDGALEIFRDPGDAVEYGKVIRNLGTFKEITKRGFYFQVTHWNVESDNITRYLFQPGRDGQQWPLRSIEDLAGQALDLAWDEKGLLKGIRQRLEKRTLALTHTADGKVSQIHFLMPDSTRIPLARFEYDPQGRLAAAYDALGQAERYEYDSSNRLTREIAKDGGVFHFKYDDADRCIRTWGLDRYDFKAIRYFGTVGLTEVTDSYGAIRRFQCNARGQVESEMDARGAQTQTRFDESGRIVSRIDPMGAELKFEFDDFGNRCKVINQVGIVTEYGFNEHHQPVRMLDGNGKEWIKKYDDANRLIESTDPLGHRRSYAYDERGLLSEIKNPDGNRKRFRWDLTGQLAAVRDFAGNIHEYVYDAFGRLAEKRGPNGKTTRHRYDLLGRRVLLELPDGTRLKYAYDAGDNLVANSLADGSIVTRKFGPCGRILSEKEPGGATTYFHWGSEPQRLDRIANSKGEAYSFLRDANGRIVSETGFDGRSLRFEYNLAGACIAEIDASGNRIELKRDALGRLLEQKLPDGGFNRYEYDAFGRLKSAVNEWSEVLFVRDAAGNLIEEIQSGRKIRSDFDARGNRVRLSIDGAAAFEYAYDPNGMQSAIMPTGMGEIRFGRDVFGRETSRSLPGVGEFLQRRDDFGKIVSQELKWDVESEHPAETLRREYVYNERGYLSRASGMGFGNAEFRYDASGRLLESRGNESGVNTYEYDSEGNMVSKATGLERETAVLAAGGRLDRLGSTEFGYDPDGRLVSKAAHSASGTASTCGYGWDALGRLRSFRNAEGKIWEYRYDALGRRISKQGPDGKETFLWDRDLILEHRARDRQTLWQFSQTDFTPLFKIEDGKLHAIFSDHLGTPKETYAAGAGNLEAIRADDWGRPSAGQGSGQAFPIRFQGQWFDSESGLSYNRYRYYDPESGRYISQDPIRLRGGINLYSYTRNPINHIDPFGLCEKDELDWSRVRSDGDTTEEHVRLHEENDLTKKDHGVFYGDGVDKVNEAWANKGDVQPIQQIKPNGSRGNDVYIIPSENSGYAGGIKGQGQNLNYVTVVTEPDSNKIVTGYPSGNGLSQGPYYSGGS